jgi:hypothetical protein
VRPRVAISSLGVCQRIDGVQDVIVRASLCAVVGATQLSGARVASDGAVFVSAPLADFAGPVDQPVTCGGPAWVKPCVISDWTSVRNNNSNNVLI